MFQINVLARVGSALSVVVLILSFMQPEVSRAQNVLTQHNDLSRSGADPNETILTTSNVTEGTFGKVFTLPIDGFTYAQPLYYADVSIAGGTHNVLYVATAHDSVYAFDADSGTEYWHVSLGTPVPSAVINTPNIQVEVGIIATPVIDSSSGAIYVTAKTYESGVQIFRLHALNSSTGAEMFGGPVEISAGSFNAAMQNQRAAVTLVKGVVYLAFGSHEDYTPYHGFVLGYSASTLQQVQVFNVTPNGGQGAIWMAGQGLVADSSNNIYATTGNSTQSSENLANDYGESFIKLVPNGNSLTLGDYFKPNQYDSWNAGDVDLGSSGAFAIPGTNYIAGGSKSGQFFVVDTTNMGKLDLSSNQSHQEFQATNGLWGSPAFFNNVMYIWGINEPLQAYKWNGSLFATSPSSQSAYAPPSGTTSGTVSVSSHGTMAGTTIVWATAPTADPDHATVGGNLYAYDATNLSNLLWSTSQNSSRDSYGNYAKFCAPTIANGKVYMGTDSEQVAVYGLLSTTTCTPTAIVPYISVAGVWSPAPESSVTVASGTVVDLGPQPVTGGSWSWTGPNGFTSTVREIDGIPLSSGVNTYVATYTNPGGCQSTQTFTITAPTTTCTPTAIVPYISVAGVWSSAPESSVTVASGTVVDLGPQPVTGGSWSWTGPNGFTSTVREIDGIPLSSGVNTYVATYTNPGGCQSTQTFTITAITAPSSTTLIPNGTYIVTAVNSGSALDDPGLSITDGKDMNIWTVNDGTNQQWTVNNVSSNVITLTNVASGQLLDVAGVSKASGALVDQWPANGQTNQQWNVISLGGGAFELTSVNSGLALSVVGGGTANGTDLDQLTYSGSTTQQWKFTAF